MEQIAEKHKKPNIFLVSKDNISKSIDILKVYQKLLAWIKGTYFWTAADTNKRGC